MQPREHAQVHVALHVVADIHLSAGTFPCRGSVTSSVSVLYM